MRVALEIEGADRLAKQLSWLETNMQQKILRKAVRAGLKPVLAAAQSGARGMVGGEMGNKIADNLILKPFRKARPGTYGMHMMIKPKVPEFVHIAKRSRHKGGRTYIPAAIEFGHIMAGAAAWGMAPGQRAKGHALGPGMVVEENKVAPIPFMRTAADVRLPGALFIMAKVIQKETEKVKDIRTVKSKTKFPGATKGYRGQWRKAGLTPKMRRSVGAALAG